MRPRFRRVFLLLALPACAGTPQRDPPRDEAATLIIPPLGRDAAAVHEDTADEPLKTPGRGAIGTPPQLEVVARDPRWGRRSPRSAALVHTEVQGLESLLSSTPTSASDRPVLLRRLAEDYCELARSGDGSASAKAIAKYQEIVRSHPQYAQLDEVRYYLALEHEMAGSLRDARSAYYDLIKSHPSSPLIPGAYFAFGEMFFLEAASDPSKNDLAEQAFKEVLKYPAATNKLYPDALLRLGQLYERKGDPPKAAAMFQKLRREHPGSDAAAKAP